MDPTKWSKFEWIEGANLAPLDPEVDIWHGVDLEKTCPLAAQSAVFFFFITLKPRVE